MHLKKAKTANGRIYLSIADSYYDKQKKISRSVTVESLGYLDDLEKQYADPIAHFSKRVEELRAEKKAKKAPIVFTFHDSDRLCIGEHLRKNFGYAALSKVYHELGIHAFFINRQRHSKEQYDANTIMKLLVYSRILFPGSKKAAFEGRGRFFEKTNYSLEDIYRCLTFFYRHRESLQVWLNDRIKKNYGRDSSLIYYDVTNYYFETDRQEGLLQKGVCKEHRPNPIVQMGLFMDRDGVPITYGLFPGNTNDCMTYRPNFGRIKKQFNLGRVITVADKGMTTGDNIWYTINTPTHDGYVFSMSVRGANKEMKKYVLEEKDYVWLGKEYKRKSRPYPRTIHVTSVNGKKIDRQVDEKQVVFWSEKYAKRARKEREDAIEKARNLINNPSAYNKKSSYGAAKYIRKITYDKKTGEILTASSILDLNEKLIHEEEALDGYYVLLTSEIDTPDDKIIEIYRGLWRIEESFHITKSELEGRPAFVWTDEHIEAHFLTCFVALTILRVLERKLLKGKYCAEQIIDALSRTECSLLQQNYYVFDEYDGIMDEVGKAVGIDFGKRIRTLGEIKKILADTKK